MRRDFPLRRLQLTAGELKLDDDHRLVEVDVAPLKSHRLYATKTEAPRDLNRPSNGFALAGLRPSLGFTDDPVEVLVPRRNAARRHA